MITNELFYSLQGEGKLAGIPSIFIRLAGCPLRCQWCDTKYTWDFKAGREYNPQQILQKIRDYPTSFIVVTGGEPMIHPDISQLLQILHENDYHVTVETAGIEFMPNLPVQLMSISPKLSNSIPTNPQHAAEHEKHRFQPEIINQLINAYEYQLKFVVQSPADLNEIAECLTQLRNIDPTKVCLMPQAIEPKDYLEKSRWLAEYCLQTGFAYSPRLQVMLWPGQRAR